LATPSQYMRGTLERLAPIYSGQLLVNVSKGIENDTLLRMSELCFEIIGDSAKFAVLSGPSHAEEVALKTPTAIVAGSNEHDLAELTQKAFMSSFFRVYTSEDVIGIELGGSLKNVFAIAAGVIDGMRLGDNPKAALITRGIAEMSRLGVALGGKTGTFSGLSGIGDMIVTCTSGHSRNRHVGEELGKGRTIEEIQKEMGMVVAEGVKTAQSAYALAKKVGVETPIITEVYQAIYEGKDSRRGVRNLMTRKPKRELA
ncbi:MAG: NAD(P)-dependent glycerol-3-phosphate dehydrogenase, partial [Victivallales bacterium]|nr:NAD(P)-dependent glycerol-3-phosphate dehydrogenase [Victivallales bacterium]